MVRKDKCKFISKLWGEVANKEKWIPGLKAVSVGLLMTFITIYLILDIVGKVPVALHINLVMLSATLGGLVFAGASFTRKQDFKKQMMAIAKLFIWATVLLMIFYFVFSGIADKNIEPFKPPTADSYVIFLLWWVAAAGIYGGSYLFSYALLKFALILRKLS